MRASRSVSGGLTFAAVFFAAFDWAGAAAPSIDPAAPEAGQTVKLTYVINDLLSFSGKPPDVPDSIDAGGIRFRRRDMKEVHFGAYNYLRVTYSAVAGEAGAFRIPSQTFRVGGKNVETETRTFRVRGVGRGEVEKKTPPDFSRAVAVATPPATPKASPSSSAAAPVRRSEPAPTASPRAKASPSPTASASTSSATPAAPAPAAAHSPALPIAHATLEIPSGEIFVGQAVPVVLRFPLPADDRFEGLIRPLLAGDGFTASELRELPAAQETFDSRAYNLITLTGTIVPFRAGAIRIPDVALKGRRLDAGSFRPTFPGQFPAPGGGGWKDFAMPLAGHEIKVLELPEEDRPAHFTGAIGTFRALPLKVSPPEAGEGEPLILKVTLQGPGNLASVSAPRLIGAELWRVHGPKEIFRSGEDSKTFEFAIIAREEQKKSPSAALNYFDPVRKKYLTLEWNSVPLYAKGPQEGSGFEAVAVPEGRGPNRGVARPTKTSGPSLWLDSRGIPWSRLRKPLFFVVSVLLFTGLFFIAARVALRRRRETNESLKRALADARDALEQSGHDPAAFYAAAAAVISARLALLRGKAGPLDDVGDQLNRAVSNVPLRDELADIFARRDELNYGAVEPGVLPADARDAVCATLQKFCHDTF